VVLLELLVRRTWRLYQHRRKPDGQLALHALIIGSTGEAVGLAKTLSAPGSGFMPLGYVQPHGATQAGDTLPVLGGIGELRQLIAERSVDCLFVASTLVEGDAVEVVAQAARREGVHVLVDPRAELSADPPVDRVGDRAVAAAGAPLSLDDRFQGGCQWSLSWGRLG
jgi:FlaA1/EpsC-like NDP-sugar epimerase